MINELIIHCVHGVLFWILDHWAEQAVFFVGFADGVIDGIVDFDYCEGMEVQFLFIVHGLGLRVLLDVWISGQGISCTIRDARDMMDVGVQSS